MTDKYAKLRELLEKANKFPEGKTTIVEFLKEDPVIRERRAKARVQICERVPQLLADLDKLRWALEEIIETTCLSGEDAKDRARQALKELEDV